MDIGIEIKDIITPLLGFLFAVLLFVIRHQREKINEKEKQLSEKRYSVYYEVFSIFFDLLKGTKNLKDNKEKDLVNRMIDIKKDLIIYAPDSVVKKFISWTNTIGDNPDNLSHIPQYLELMIEIRKDMGHPRTKVKEDELLRSIMSNTEEFEKFKKQIAESSTKRIS